MIDLAQSYATLLGLLADIAGVIIVSSFWLKSFGGGMHRLQETQTQMNLRWATKARETQAELAAAKGANASWGTLFRHEMKLAGYRMSARVYSERVKALRRHYGLEDRSVLTADDFWDEAAIKAHSLEIQAHTGALIARGAPDSVFPAWGFRLIIGGFVLQFIGALPV